MGDQAVEQCRLRSLKSLVGREQPCRGRPLGVARRKQGLRRHDVGAWSAREGGVHGAGGHQVAGCRVPGQQECQVFPCKSPTSKANKTNNTASTATNTNIKKNNNRGFRGNHKSWPASNTFPV